jgi:hypothetical protein
MLDQIGDIVKFNGYSIPDTIGSIAMLYTKDQNKFIYINWLLFFSNLKIVTILCKFSDKIITSAAFKFNSDFAFILTPTKAYCKHGISFKPFIKIIIYHHQSS